MAKVKQLDVMTGSIKNLSFYTRQGSDQVYARTKGGASKEKIKNSPAFAAVRKNNKEFGGCSKMSKEIRNTFHALAHVSDYNLSSVLSAIAKTIQKEDTVNPIGERTISLSKYQQCLTGFDFNRNNRFDTLLRIPLSWSIDREMRKAVVRIPSFSGSTALYVRGNYPLFRILISLGDATDMRLNNAKTSYEYVHPKTPHSYRPANTEWYSTQATVPQQELTLEIRDETPDFCNQTTLILSIAIEFGTLDALGRPTPVKYGGAGKILGTK